MTTTRLATLHPASPSLTRDRAPADDVISFPIAGGPPIFRTYPDPPDVQGLHTTAVPVASPDAPTC